MQPRLGDGKYTTWVHPAAPDDVLGDASFLTLDRADDLRHGDEVELEGPEAALVIPGAQRVSLQYADPFFYAEADFNGFDLAERIDDMLTGDQNHAYSALAFIEERNEDINDWFADMGIVRSGEWDNSMLTAVARLIDVPPTFAAARDALTADTEWLRGDMGRDGSVLSLLHGHLLNTSCTRCFGDLSNYSSRDGLCETCNDEREDEED